jgi:hypothetical protein
VLHVGPDEMTRRQCAAEGKLSCQRCRSHDTGQPASIVTRVGGVGAANTKHIKHGTLWLENGAATECANLEGRH